MKQLNIDPEFRDKVPPLTEEELKTLEENIVADGRVMLPIVTWNGTIIDGHNRYSIVQKHPEIPFDTVERDFADRYEAIVWICRNQLGRRNLTPQDKTYLLGKQYEAQKMTNKLHDESGRFAPRRQNDATVSGRVREQIAKEHGVGVKTVERAEKYAKGVDAIEKDSPGMKSKLLSGSINTTKTEIANYPNLEKKEKGEMIEQLHNGGTVSSNKDRQKSGNTNENRERWSATRKAADELYDTERQTVYTPDDLKEELDFIVQDFIKKAKRTLAIRSTVLNEPGTREKIAAVLLAAETAVKEMKGLVL